MSAGAAKVSRGEIVAGQYQLDRILGQGGMGTVWAARDLRLGRSVAIKFLGESAANSSTQRERFAREVRLASRIRSPHVVQIFGDGVTPGAVPYVVMELLDGENLASHLARVRRCSLADAEPVLDQVCRALSSAHAAGLVHRDIKPANIFLTPQADGGNFVRLLDFGIAKEVGDLPNALTRSGEVLGTGYYMSPEQLRAPGAVRAATDVWSLGVVLYEMLTGRLPFEASTFPSLVVCVVEGKYRPACELCPDLPPVIDAILARALQVNPARRFARVDELASAFSRAVRANTSEAVIKPEVVRALRAGTTTWRMPRRPRLQDLSTVLMRKGSSAGFWLLLALGAAALAWGLTQGPEDAPAAAPQPSAATPTAQDAHGPAGSRGAPATQPGLALPPAAASPREMPSQPQPSAAESPGTGSHAQAQTPEPSATPARAVARKPAATHRAASPSGGSPLPPSAAGPRERRPSEPAEREHAPPARSTDHVPEEANKYGF